MVIARSLKYLTYLLVSLVITPGTTLPSPVTDDAKDQQVADHRTVRVYSAENSGAAVLFANTIFQDRSGVYWIGNPDGAHRYDNKRDLWRSFTKDVGALAAEDVEMIGQSMDKKLWFVPNDPYPGPDVSSFDGRRWRKINRKLSHPTLRDNVTAMFSGKDGRVWFALEERLVNYDGRRWSRPINLSQAIAGPRPTVRFPLKAVPKLFSADAEELDPETRDALKEYGYQKLFAVQAGLQDSEGYIWLATFKGIVRFDERKHQWKECPEMKTRTFVRHIYEDRQGRLWFADNHSHVYVYDKATGSWTPHNLLDHVPPNSGDDLRALHDGGRSLAIRGIYQDKRGQLMFATREGLLTHTEAEGVWRLFTPENSSLPSRIVTCIMEDRSGRVWIGSGRGIVVLEP